MLLEYAANQLPVIKRERPAMPTLGSKMLDLPVVITEFGVVLFMSLSDPAEKAEGVGVNDWSCAPTGMVSDPCGGGGVCTFAKPAVERLGPAGRGGRSVSNFDRAIMFSIDGSEESGAGPAFDGATTTVDAL